MQAILWIIGVLALLGLAARTAQYIDKDILPFRYIALCFIGWAVGLYAFFFKDFFITNTAMTIILIIVIPIGLVFVLKFLVWAISGLGEL